MYIYGMSHVHAAQPINPPHRLAPAQAPTSAYSAGGVDQLDISPEADFVAQARDLPEIREDRVAAIREQIASAVHMIVQQNRFPDGSRKVTHITEVTGMEGEIVQLQDIFLFKQEGYDEKGKVKGRFVATGNIPDLYQDLSARGIPVDLSIFKVPERN